MPLTIIELTLETDLINEFEFHSKNVWLSCVDQVQRQLSSIVSGLYPDLLYKLIECIKFASKHTPAAVPSLAAALASMAVQWREWNNPLETLGTFGSSRCKLKFSSQYVGVHAFLP